MFTLSAPAPVRLNSVAFSPDGRHVAACGESGAVRVWDLATREFSLSTRCGRRSADSIFYSSDPECLYVHVRPEQLVAREPAGKRWLDITAPDAVRLVAYLPEKRVCCYCPLLDSVGLYALPDFRVLWTRQTEGERNDLPSSPTALAGSPDGRFVGCAFDTGEVGILDAGTGETRHRFHAGERSSTQLAIAPGGGAFASLYHSRLCYRRTTPNDEVKHRMFGLTHFMAVAWHPSGSFFATVKGDGTVDYWDGLDGERRESFDWKTGKLLDIAFDSTGDRAAACSEKGEVVVWDVDH